ncbi:MAG: hypothetical protein KJ747_06165, partial [Actinobacteria bacterium]|nr:hypothetical protein [Actinomycetota bacterium]MCG2807839.1 NEW3 domain-containing protein [Coriobacteriia bacterium]
MVALLLMPASIASGIVSTTITIDADFGDWAGVRGDAANTVHDTQLSDPDPDWPGQPDRDTYLCNATWDSQYLYLAYRRTAGGTKAITFTAYIDRGADGLLQNTDVVAWWTVGQSTSSRYADAHAPSPTAGIFQYNQAIDGKGGPFVHPGGDPMGHDGETPDGWANVQSGNLPPTQPMDGWFADNGIEFEGKVAWSDLGVAAGSPIAIHFANANGESFGVKWTPSNTYKVIGGGNVLEENRGQIEDNVDGLWWLRSRGLEVSPDNAQGAKPGETVIYTHTIKNTSNTADTINLSTLPGGWPAIITDTSGNPISSVNLAAGASTTMQVRVTIPVGAADGSQNVTTLIGNSQTDPAVTDSATDTTFSGRVTVTPDRSGSMAPGQTITYRFTVGNNLPGAGVYDLGALSALNWTTRITDTLGNQIANVSLAGGESREVLVSIDVPLGAAVGIQDVTRLTATLQGQPAVKATATATTGVLGPLLIEPSRTGFTGAGTTIDYLHTVTNSWPTSRTATLGFTSPHSWPVKFFKTDGVTEITSLDLGPNGDAQGFITRVYVPTGVAANTVDAMQVSATANGLTVSVTDTTTIRRLATYKDVGYTDYSTEYTLGESIYGRATGLASGSVYFKWYDAAGNLVRTSPVRTVDTMGMAFDTCPSTLTQPTGGWRCELYNNSNTLLETSSFNVRWNAEITALSASDAPTVGSTVAVSSSVRNDNTQVISNSTMTYTIWWDENGDGVFGANDTYIDSAGLPHTWDGSTPISTHATSINTVAAGATWT